MNPVGWALALPLGAGFFAGIAPPLSVVQAGKPAPQRSLLLHVRQRHRRDRAGLRVIHVDELLHVAHGPVAVAEALDRVPGLLLIIAARVERQLVRRDPPSRPSAAPRPTAHTGP